MLRLLSLSALFVSTSSFFFGNSGCGCATPPICLPMPSCPPPVQGCAPTPSCVPASPALPPLLGSPPYSGPSFGGSSYAQPPPAAAPLPLLPQSPVYEAPQPQPEFAPVGPGPAAAPVGQTFVQPGGGYVGSPPLQQQPPVGPVGLPPQGQMPPPIQAQPAAPYQEGPALNAQLNAQRDAEPEQSDVLVNRLQQEALAAGRTNEEVIEEQEAAVEKPGEDFSTALPLESTTIPEVAEERVVDIATLNLTDDPLCNSEDLRKLMLANIDENLNSSKRLIQLAAEAQFGGRFDVICANGDFSYVTNTELFCQETKGDVSCYTYRQL
ncbi:hypothetical protein V3C99_016844 [Haemonchus contortus]